MAGQPHREQQGRDRFADYVPVAQRIEEFHARYAEGRITTTIVQHDVDAGFVLMRAEIFRANGDADPAATGHAAEVRGESYVNKTSYIENCETSAVGRALANLNFRTKAADDHHKQPQDARAAAARPRAVPSITPRQELIRHVRETAKAKDVLNELGEKLKRMGHAKVVDCTDGQLGDLRAWLDEVPDPATEEESVT